MFKKSKSFILGFMFCAIIMVLAGTALAAWGTQKIDVTYKDIKLNIDGTQITPKDANGNAIEPFIYNGTTYLPIRAVGEAFGKSVRWDGDTSTVYISKKTDTPAPAPSTQKQYLGFDLKAYQSGYRQVEFESTINMGGNVFGNAITLRPLFIARPATADFNLNGDYTSISGFVGKVDGSKDVDATLNIYGDGKLIISRDLRPNMFGDSISFNVTGVKQLKLEVTASEDTIYAVADMELIK